MGIMYRANMGSEIIEMLTFKIIRRPEMRNFTMNRSHSNLTISTGLAVRTKFDALAMNYFFTKE